jgi:hypothetical protein
VITRPTSEGLLCVRQADHAGLAGDLGRHWGGSAVPPIVPFDSVVFAMGHHDAGWPELDERPVYDPETRAPRTFRAYPLEEALAVAERSVSRVSAADPYAGWLVSRHFASFHEDSGDPRAASWARWQAQRRDELLQRARPRVPREALHPQILEANFDWLQLMDALSLCLCEDRESWQGRPMALRYGEAPVAWRYRQTAAGSDKGGLFIEGSVEPWPFASPRVKERVEGRLLSGAEWPDAPALLAAWQVAPLVGVEVALTRA